MNAPVPACWRCGATLVALLLPLRREEVCPSCDADLHVCRQCRWYNTRVSDACDEPLAGGVGNKERANFCGYFTLASAAPATGGDAAAARARSELEALFGAGPSTPDADATRNRSELERLFGLHERDA
ncbi:MAG: hypothetical protein RLW62_21105 [Gammaproteobacteria bacterium]